MNETTDAPAIFAPLWTRKWIILAVAVLVAAGSYLYYKHKAPTYSSTTQVYLSSSSEEQALINGTSVKKNGLSAVTQTSLINSPLVHETVRRRLRTLHAPAARAALRGKVRAKSAEKSPFITIGAEAHSPAGSALLANTTAQVYIERQNAAFEHAIDSAISIARHQLARVEIGLSRPAGAKGKAGGTNTSATLQAATLSTKINQLEAQRATAGLKQVAPAKRGDAVLLSPKPRKNAIFGFVLGFVLAGVGAYAYSRFDRRLRTLAAIEADFHARMLTALPLVKRPIVNRDGQLAPSKLLREPLRRLQTTLALGARGDHANGRLARSILFLSADAGDGKSMLAANLALVQRDAGERVIVVEADFRRPVLARLLQVSDAHGLADVLEGRLPLDGALQQVPAHYPAPSANSAAPAAQVATLVERGGGSISVLTGNGGVANPPALLAGQQMQELLSSLAEEYDHVLIDAPSPLAVSDVLPVLAMVEGIVIVARVGHTRQASCERLMSLLEYTPSAPVLGVVANAAPARELAKYGFSAPPPSRRRSLLPLSR